ncbi:MAG: hypothetical protein J7521_19085 [Caulobacter sp.]|nr:hypothetical protein [Caulobacter sp.]
MTPQALSNEIARVRESGLLGRSQALSRFFDFLVEQPAQGSAKESEIAFSVFGRSATFSTEQDATVRVYAHRLRRKLEEFNDRSPSPFGVRLSLPRGEYRIAVEPTGATPPAAPRHRRPAWIIAIAAAALVAAFALAAGAARLADQDPARLPPWSVLATDKRPLVIVVGDYYLFGDTGEGMAVERLVREFSINSKDELYAYMMRHPDTSGRYADLGLTYLPLSTASALQHVMPLLPRGKAVRVVPVSSFSPDLLKTADILYLGHLSGLGPLRESAFAGSRFAFGETYDEIVDRRTGHRYEGRAGADAAGGHAYRDYGYIAGFPGPAGNRIMVIAGTRDASAQGVAEVATEVTSLRELMRATGRADAFEALYEVQGKGVVDIETRLVLASPRDPADRNAATTASASRFPLS